MHLVQYLLLLAQLYKVHMEIYYKSEYGFQIFYLMTVYVSSYKKTKNKTVWRDVRKKYSVVAYVCEQSKSGTFGTFTNYFSQQLLYDIMSDN